MRVSVARRLLAVAFAMQLGLYTSASAAAGDKSEFLVFHKKRYLKESSTELLKGIQTTGRIPVGTSVAGTFLYSGKSAFKGSSQCGLIRPDDVNISLMNAMDVARLHSTLQVAAVCFKTSDQYEKFSKDCHFTIFDGSCRVLILGKYSGKRRLKMAIGLIPERNAHVISPDVFKILEQDTKVGRDNILNAAIAVRDVYGQLGKIESLVK